MGPQWPGSGLWAGQLLSSYGGARGLCKVGKPTAGSGHWEKEAERRTRQQQVGAGSAATVLCGRPTRSGGCHAMFSFPSQRIMVPFVSPFMPWHNPRTPFLAQPHIYFPPFPLPCLPPSLSHAPWLTLDLFFSLLCTWERAWLLALCPMPNCCTGLTNI